MKRALIAVAIAVLAGAVWFALRSPNPTTTTSPQSDAPSTPDAPQQPNAPTAAALTQDASQDPGPLPTLHGEVRDDTGPIAQATVELRRRGETEEPNCETRHRTTTIGGGTFDTPPLCPGQYDVRAARGSNVATAVARLARGVEPDALHLFLREGTRLTVRVVDGKKQPLAEAHVNVQDAESGFLLETVTDDKGVAVADGLSPRTHGLHATKPGYLDAWLSNRTLAAGEDEVSLTLLAGVTFEGRVLSPDGEPLDDVWVRLSKPRKELGGGFDSVQGDNSHDGGEFSIGPILPGAYVFVATHDVYTRLEQPVRVPGPRATFKLGRGASIDGTFLDADGAPVSEGEVSAEVGPHGDSRTGSVDAWGRFHLDGLTKARWAVIGVTRSADGGSQGIAVTQVDVKQDTTYPVTLQLQRGLSITGRCTNSDGTPADTDVLAIERALFDKLRLTGFDPTRVPPGSVAISACPGRFTVDGLKPGRYALLACGSDEDPTIASAGDEDVAVTCIRGRLRFRVLDPQGRPVEKFALGGGPEEDHPGGVYDDPSDVTDDVITVRAAGFAPLQRRVQAKRGERTDLGDLQLTAARKLAGQVVDGSDGKPVAGAEVSFGFGDDDAVLRARTRADGTFELVGAPSEASRVFARHPKYRPAETSVGPTDTRLTVTLSPGLQLGGAVITRDGRTPLGFEVEARGAGVVRRAPVQDGRYTLGSLEPGEWKLRLRGPDVSAFDPLTVTLIGSGNVTADFVERLGGVRVTVLPLDEDGQPVVAYAWLVPGRVPRPSTDQDAWRLTNENGIASEGDPSGAHSFDSVPPGPYTALVRAKEVPGLVWTESFEVSASMPSPLRLVMPRGTERLK